MLAVHKDHVKMIVAEYLDNHILPKATGWHKLGVGAMGFVVASRMSSIIEDPQTTAMLHTLGAMNEASEIDFDYLREMALASLKKGGDITPPVFGYTFDSQDIEGLYSIAKKYATGATNV